MHLQFHYEIIHLGTLIDYFARTTAVIKQMCPTCPHNGWKVIDVNKESLSSSRGQILIHRYEWSQKENNIAAVPGTDKKKNVFILSVFKKNYICLD